MAAGVPQPETTRRLDRVTAAVASRTFPIYATLSGLYVLFRDGSFTNMPDRLTDTPTYEAVAHLALWNWRFYAGERGFTIPLFFKVFTTSESRTVAQLLFSIVAWLTLAWVVSRCVETAWLRPVSFGAVVAFSLTTEVILWDTLLLSESVTLGLSALLCAAALALVRRPGRARYLAFAVLLLLWAFARDANAYVALFLAPIVALTLITARHRRMKLAVVACCVGVFALDFASADAGKRWLQPLRNVVTYRVLPSPAMRAYFERRGPQLMSNWASSPAEESRVRSAYVGYLVAHPVYALTAPLHGRQQAQSSTPRNIEALLDPDLRPYNDNASHRFLTLPQPLEDALFPRGPPVVLALLALALALAAWAWRSRGAQALWIVPIGALATTYPHFLVAWHSDGAEVDRHALEAALLLRLGILLLLVFAIDRLVSTRRSPRAGRSMPSRPSV